MCSMGAQTVKNILSACSAETDIASSIKTLIVIRKVVGASVSKDIRFR